MLCFDPETEQGVAEAIIRSVIDFKRDPWPKVSDNAKDLIRKMLNPDPGQRLTAQQVLGIVSSDHSYFFFSLIIVVVRNTNCSYVSGRSSLDAKCQEGS